MPSTFPSGRSTRSWQWPHATSPCRGKRRQHPRRRRQKRWCSQVVRVLLGQSTGRASTGPQKETAWSHSTTSARHAHSRLRLHEDTRAPRLGSLAPTTSSRRPLIRRSRHPSPALASLRLLLLDVTMMSMIVMSPPACCRPRPLRSRHRLTTQAPLRLLPLLLFLSMTVAMSPLGCIHPRRPPLPQLQVAAAATSCEELE